MKRRDFLRTTGLLGAGGANVLAACGDSEAAESQPGERRPSADGAGRKVLVTSAHSELARTIAAEMKREYRVRLTSPLPVQTDDEFVRSELDRDDATGRAVRAVDAVVHLAEPGPDAGHDEEIDHRTRCTYNLLQAAAKEGVRSVVYLSSLSMLFGYDERFQVDEDWRPRPTPDSGALSDYLGEFTCREFARAGRLNVVVLRLGRVASAEALAEEAAHEAWVDPRDAAQAVSRALDHLVDHETATPGRWSVFHVLSQSPCARFPIGKARRILGYRPEFGGRNP